MSELDRSARKLGQSLKFVTESNNKTWIPVLGISCGRDDSHPWRQYPDCKRFSDGADSAAGLDAAGKPKLCCDDLDNALKKSHLASPALEPTSLVG